MGGGNIQFQGISILYDAIQSKDLSSLAMMPIIMQHLTCLAQLGVSEVISLDVWCRQLHVLFGIFKHGLTLSSEAFTEQKTTPSLPPCESSALQGEGCTSSVFGERKASPSRRLLAGVPWLPCAAEGPLAELAEEAQGTQPSPAGEGLGSRLTLGPEMAASRTSRSSMALARCWATTQASLMVRGGHTQGSRAS